MMFVAESSGLGDVALFCHNVVRNSVWIAISHQRPYSSALSRSTHYSSVRLSHLARSQLLTARHQQCGPDTQKSAVVLDSAALSWLHLLAESFHTSAPPGGGDFAQQPPWEFGACVTPGALVRILWMAGSLWFQIPDA